MSENDTWNLLLGIASAVKAYKDAGLTHGDIQPQNCFILDNKNVKLIDSCFLNDVTSSFDRVFKDPSYKAPLSPEAMQGLLMGPQYISFDIDKNDIWGIGNFWLN